MKKILSGNPFAFAASSGRESSEKPKIILEVDPVYESFKSVRITKRDQSKPRKPPLEVEVVMQDGTLVEGLDPDHAVYTFKDPDGRMLEVSIATAGHIDDLHIHAKEPGSKFDYASLTKLMQDIALHFPDGIMERQGIFSLDTDMGKHMGDEGMATMGELLADDILAPQDIAMANMEKRHVFALNRAGTVEDKKSFIEAFHISHPGCKIQFQLVRDSVVVPCVKIPKRPTTKLFMMIGRETDDKLSLFTIAPGRSMPRHPNPVEHMDRDGKIDETTFNRSSEEWFDTVMLVG